MVEIYKVNGAKLCIGDDQDYERIKNNEDWRSVRVCKFGSGGHKDTLGYYTQAAPKGKNYLQVEKDNRLSINILDLDDPNMIPFECIVYALDYIKRELDSGKNILIACNKGQSRAPSTGLAFLRAIGELPYHFIKAENIFKTLYPQYEPGLGIRQVLKEHWTELENMEK